MNFELNVQRHILNFELQIVSLRPLKFILYD